MGGNTCETFKRMAQFLELWNVILLLTVHTDHGKYNNFISKIIAQIIVWTFHMKRGVGNACSKAEERKP